jgi:hypothetical protein
LDRRSNLTTFPRRDPRQLHLGHSTAADAGAFAALGGEDVGVAGVGVAPGQVLGANGLIAVGGLLVVSPYFAPYASGVPEDDDAAGYGRYPDAPSQADLERVFFLDDEDRTLVDRRHGST